MKSILKKLLAFSVAATLASFFMFPVRVTAVTPPLLSYGGTNMFSIPCTCTEGVMWAFYAPLFLSSVPMAGPISYVPGASWLFANFVPPIESQAPYEGGFMPGVPTCWMYAGYFCFPLYDLGVTAFTGTGLPGGGY